MISTTAEPGVEDVSTATLYGQTQRALENNDVEVCLMLFHKRFNSIREKIYNGSQNRLK